MSDLIGNPDCCFSHVTAQITRLSSQIGRMIVWVGIPNLIYQFPGLRTKKWVGREFLKFLRGKYVKFILKFYNL